MAEFKINGHMKVKTLKELFFNEFEGTLRVYDGKKLADDEATLASIRSNEGAKGGELSCRASRTVGKFEQEMWDVFGIKVQVATKDNWVLVLDGITLSKIKDIPNYAKKETMEEFLSYQRKGQFNEEILTASSKIDSVRIELRYTEYEYAPTDEDDCMFCESFAFMLHESSEMEIYVNDELLEDADFEEEYSDYKPYKFNKSGYWEILENSVTKTYFLNVENFDVSKLCINYDCYDVPFYRGDTAEMSWFTLKYDGEEIYSQDEDDSENHGIERIFISAEYVEEIEG
jgi:hypothetical protein